MNNKEDGRILLTFMLAIIVIFTACGTLEVGVEPDGSQADPLNTATQTAGAADAATVVAATPEATQEPTQEATAKPTETAAGEESQDELPPVAFAPPEITMLDETWFKYTNYQLGFSINFPRTKIHFMGSCVWNEENGDRSYRYEYSHVPVKIFEDENTVYITSEYQHVLSGETRETDADGGTRIFFSECEAVMNSLELLHDPDYYQEMWEIVVQDIQNDGDLDAFLKTRYGSSCSLGEKVMSGQDGVYDIRIQGDGKDLSETLCPLNYGTVVKYYPEWNKVIAWDTGQAYTFSADITNSVTHDQEMIDSFRILTVELTGSAGDETETGEPEAGAHDYSGWLPFTNGALGYSLMYPGNAEVIGLDLSQRVDFSGPLVNNKPWPMFSVEHYINNLPEGTDFRQSLVEDYADYLETTDGEFTGLVEELTIGGVPAIRTRYQATAESDARDDYHFVHGDKMFRISITHVDGREDWAVYDQFLQSITLEPV
jgi:hypothetical protein